MKLSGKHIGKGGSRISADNLFFFLLLFHETKNSFYDFETILKPYETVQRCPCHHLNCKCQTSYSDPTHEHAAVLKYVVFLKCPKKITNLCSFTLPRYYTVRFLSISWET